MSLPVGEGSWLGLVLVLLLLLLLLLLLVLLLESALRASRRLQPKMDLQGGDAEADAKEGEGDGETDGDWLPVLPPGGGLLFLDAAGSRMAGALELLPMSRAADAPDPPLRRSAALWSLPAAAGRGLLVEPLV